MNVQRISSSNNVPDLFEENDGEKQSVSHVFFRSLDAVKESTDAADNQSNRPLENEIWAGQSLVCEELRDRTLKKSWLIEGLPNGAQADGETTLISSTAVTDGFKNRVRAFLKGIPASLRRIVRNNRTEILVVGDVEEVDQELALQPARRHLSEEVVGNLPAFYEARLNALVFAEKPDANMENDAQAQGSTLHRTRKFLTELRARFSSEGSVRSYSGLARCAAHEFGHALDKALSNFSSSKAFQDAFLKDLAQMSEEEKSRLWYFTAPYAVGEQQASHNAAQEELFAELFAVHQGLGSASREVDNLLIKKFPTVNQLFETKMASLDVAENR